MCNFGHRQLENKTMFKTVIAVTASVALLALAPTVGLAKSFAPTIAKSDLASICQQSNGGGDQDVMLNLGQGNSVSITVHCDQTDTTSVGTATDTGESEKGATEAAEGGVED